LTVTLTGPLSAQSAPGATPAITRADLAARYLFMDVRYAEADSLGRISDSVRVYVNRTFDRSTLSFFAGRFATTAAIMDSAMAALGPSGLMIRPVPSTLIGTERASVVRQRLQQRLAAIDSSGPLARAVVAAQARVRLLVDTISPERSAEFLSKPADLAAAVSREIDQLAKGRNPYAKATGDRWTAYRGAGGEVVPMRLIAPPAAASKPVGMLIALHGAGGDENMFPMSYGRGIAMRLASEAGLLFVSPSTTAFMKSPEQFDSLLAVLRADYQIDASRIYVMGHSMGAGAAARLAQQRPQQLAAVACLAGGAAVNVPGAPPMLFIGASLDPIIPARTVQAAASGTPTGRYEERPNEGHTLMVRGGVQRAVPWLLQHRRSDAR
jgi:predicted esterase